MADDRDFVHLFDERRRADEASAPPFAEVLRRRRTAPVAPIGTAIRLAAVAVLLAAAVVTAVRPRNRAPDAVGLEPTPTIAAWASPTDWLLRTPGRQLLDEVPILLDSSTGKTGEIGQGRGPAPKSVAPDRDRETRKGDRS